jgi:SAM-dependent methyltransferase
VVIDNDSVRIRTSDSCQVCAGETAPYCTKSSYGVTWQVLKCLSCGHGFVVNRPTSEQLSKIYTKAAGSEEEAFALPSEWESDRNARTMASTVARLTNERGLVLDVGSGCGVFSYHLHKKGFSPVLLDYNQLAERSAAQIPGARFVWAGFEDFASEQPFSAILMSQSLEHALNPLTWLRRAADMLQPGGLLAIALPNFRGVYRLLGARDPFICPPFHLNFFTPVSMRLALRSAGFDVVRLDSHSNVANVSSHSIRRRIIGRSWNSLSWILNATTAGIMLRAFGRRAGGKYRAH